RSARIGRTSLIEDDRLVWRRQCVTIETLVSDRRFRQTPNMAWRIHDSVIRGEIDNRVKGRVRGKLWLDSLAKPVTLELEGNACSDLAGCLLKFKNSAKTFPMRKKPQFDQVQRGRIGNLTASQKVRVFTVPDEQAFAMMDRGEKPPERTA